MNTVQPSAILLSYGEKMYPVRSVDSIVPLTVGRSMQGDRLGVRDANKAQVQDSGDN